MPDKKGSSSTPAPPPAGTATFRPGSGTTLNVGFTVRDLAVVMALSSAATFMLSCYMAAPASSGQVGLTSAHCQKRPYNNAALHSTKLNADGSTSYSLYLITDLDHDSALADKKNTWHSLGLQGTLTLAKDKKSAKVAMQAAKPVTSQIAAGGRSMELSDLVVFDGRLLSCDDRTGLIYEIDPTISKAFPWVFLPDGPGVRASKGLKAEWMTVKDGELIVGGLGKEWTTTTGVYVNDHPMYIKVISPEGAVRHVPWKEVFVKARRTIGVEYPGYAIHEAVQWSALHRRWFFLPRRASNETYDEEADEHRGTNFLISSNDNFEDWQVATVGDRGDGSRGFSAFQFVPGTSDRLIVALKSEEKDGKPVASYISLIDTQGNVIMADTRLEGSYKYEGVAFA